MRIDRALVQRWRTPEGQLVADEVFARLLAGRPLEGLQLGVVDGRVDLRGLPAPIPSRLKRFESEGWFVEELGGLLRFDHRTLTGLDLRGAVLDSLRMFHCQIVDCCFDGARLQDLRMWATTVERSSFQQADLRRSSVGGWYEGRGNIFSLVDFRGANLRGIESSTATYIDCDFSNATLVKIEFESSSFIRCRFAGPLRNIIFWDHGFQTGKPDPNPMEDVDFSDAVFSEVEFRRLDLERVKLPTAPGHLVFSNYSCIVASVLEELTGQTSADARGLYGGFSVLARWVLPGQRRGIINLADFDGLVDRALIVDLLARAEQRCR